MFLRISHSIGSGYLSARHSRAFAEIYDSKLVVNLVADLKSLDLFFPCIWVLKARSFDTGSWPLAMRSGQWRGIHQKAVGSGAALSCRLSNHTIPMRASADDDTLEMTNWPLLLTYDMVSCLKVSCAQTRPHTTPEPTQSRTHTQSIE